MPTDNNTRSRKRKPRKRNKKCVVAQQDAGPSTSNVQKEEINITIPPVSNDINSVETSYKVEFPNKQQDKKGNIIKSRSLDDDDKIKITEISDEEKFSNISESTAIVSEAESDIEWETTIDLEQQNLSEQQFGKLSIISLPLEEHITFETSHISPEDERSLRDFLEGLNLVNSPEESAKRIEKPADTTKAKKAKKRAVLAQHFMPYYHNQRYLDAISEEGSDLSDKDTKNTNFMCRVLDYDDDDDDDDDVFEDLNLKEQKLRNKFDGAILVGTRLIENNNTDRVIIKEATWTTSVAESQCGAEVVYLEDSSSNSMTPSDLLDLEDTAGDVDADDEEDITFSDIDLNSSESSLMKAEVTMTSSSDAASRDIDPDTNTKSTETQSDTPQKLSIPAGKTIDFLHKLLSTLSNDNTGDILMTLNEEEVQYLPPNIRNKLQNVTIDDKEVIVEEINNFKMQISRESSQEKQSTIETIPTVTSFETNEIKENMNKETQTEIEVINKDEPNKNIETENIKDINQIEHVTNTEFKIEVIHTSIKQTLLEKLEKEEELNIGLKHINESLQIQNEDEQSTQITKERKSSESEDLKKELKNLCDGLQNQTPTREISQEKCSENEEELKKELKTLCEDLEKQEENKHSDNTSTSVSRSDSASSARSSQCTAVYNPLHSSLSNIASLLRENSVDKDETEPLALKEICVKALLSMPFGKDVIEELANVSQSLEEMTCHTPIIPKRSPIPPKRKSTNIDASSILPVPVVQSMDSERWVGLPSEENPNLVVCLSPSQKEFIDKTKAIPNEADSLLDLHRKFIERRGYHEEYDFVSKPNMDTNKIKIDFNNKHGNIHYDTYIKQLVREVPIQVEKQINKPVNNKIYRDAPVEGCVQSDRLKARHLGEWLNLARNDRAQINNNTRSVNKLVSQRSCEDAFGTSAVDSSRRYSLPFNLYEQQMQYILQKEQEIQKEIEKLNEEKSKLEKDMSDSKVKEFDAGKYQISRKGDIAILQTETPNKIISSPSSEKFREQMYNEYMCKIQERQERKQNKVIKIKISTEESHENTKHAIGIEDEFMHKVRERKDKLGLTDDTEKDPTPPLDSPGVKVLDGEALTEATRLPKHLQEFVDIANTEPSTDGVWSPGKSGEPELIPSVTETTLSTSPGKESVSTTGASGAVSQEGDEPAPVVWTPRSAGSSPTADRKEFRPVNFESPVLKRKNLTQNNSGSGTPETSSTIPPPWEQSGQRVPGEEERRLTSSQSAPAAGLTSLGKLPRAQNPTITLLQKAREGQLPRGASYIEDHHSQNQKSRMYTVKHEYLSESETEKPKKMADLGPRKFEGIGPTTKDGMPIVLRSEVKDSNQAKWYKRMYDTLHRPRNDDEYVTVRYKTRRGRYPYTSAGGYLSEPEPNAYDSDAAISASKYATLDRRRFQTGKDKENEYITYTVPRNKYMSASVRHSTDVYKNQPGRIEDYVPGHSSISEKEAKEHLEQQKHVPSTRSYMSQALKESGYESDSTLVFRRREDAALQLNPHDQKEAYKTIQKGGEVPLHGLRKPAPERPKEPVLGQIPPPRDVHDKRLVGPESPRKYVEDEVTIHYRSPVRHEVKEVLSEEELARRQAEAMRRIYQEERRRKYLQELQDMNSRRHTDNFIPSQKSPIPLNRYDDFGDDVSVKPRARSRSPESRLVARALYNFVGQSARELTFRKGDIIYIRRQVDKNWFEGEHNAMLGLFPSNYVEIIPYDGIKSTPRKAHEGQARAKFNFIAQTHLELSLAKGELVVLTRRVDDNWFEGRIGSRKGIFPVSYVEILIDPSEKQEMNISSTKPVASPAAHSLLLNGSAGGKESMGSHHYQPSYTSQQQTTTSFHAKPVNVIGTSTSYSSLTRTQKITSPAVNEALHIDTQSEPVPYRALYKYRPQNDDELELQEGDTVFVLEKCDDGWYVGSSQRTGSFGTFPGNYVERI